MKILYAFIFLILSNLQLKAEVKEIFLYFNQTEMDSIYKNWDQDIYIPCKVVHNGKEYSNCEIRLRGDTSREYPRKSLKIKFRDELFENKCETLNLNVEYYDTSRVRSLLSAHIFRKSGVPVFDIEHIKVFWNDQYNGLYLSIENIDNRFLSNKGLSENSTLYKASIDGALLSEYENIEKLWEKKINEDKNYDDLKSIIWEINNTTDSNWNSFLHKKFDYNELISVFAINFLISNISTYYHNYYLYHDLDTDKWQMIPWDLDKSMSTYGLYADWRSCGDQAWHHDNPLYVRSLIDDITFNDIRNKIDEISNKIFNSNSLNPIIDSLQNVLKSSIFADALYKIKNDKQYAEQFDDEKKYIAEKLNILKMNITSRPQCFRVQKLDTVQFGKIMINWDRPKNNANKGEILYNIFYGRVPYYDSSKTKIINGIADTTYIIDDLNHNGYHYVRVEAYNTITNERMLAFDKHNRFTYYTNPNYIDCIIENDLTLTEAKSPYFFDCPIRLSANTKLIIEPGVVIYVNSLKDNNFYGDFISKGTKEKPIKIICKKFDSTFIFNFHSNSKFECKYTEFINGRFNINNTDVSIKNSRFIIDAIVEKDTTAMGVGLYIKNQSSILIDSSYFSGNNTFEYLLISDATKPIVQNNTFTNSADMIEYIWTKDGIIHNNIVYNSSDDAIDLNGCENTTITNNILYDISDKGISIDGNNREVPCRAIVSNNLIVNSMAGVAIKSGAEVEIINNTFHKNHQALAIFEKTPSWGGGKGQVNNCIFSDCNEVLYIDDKSTCEINYSLSNNHTIKGNNNLNADPLFINPDDFNFYLKINSPCIDKGNPSSKLDPDGSRADIGAFYFHQNKQNNSIVINEINYNSADNYNSGDWVELYNNTKDDIDLTGWYFSDSDNDHKYHFPKGFVLKSDAYVVLCENIKLYDNYFESKKPRFGDMSFGFSGDGELIRLFDKNATLHDFVNFDDKLPWDTMADGKGNTLELIQPDLDNSLALNWMRSKLIGGSPCKANTITGTIDDADNTFSIYPNPANYILYIKTYKKPNIGTTFEIFDIEGKSCKKGNIDNFETMVEASELPSNSYYIIINSVKRSYIFPFIIHR